MVTDRTSLEKATPTEVEPTNEFESDVHEAFASAASFAKRLGHNWLGTEHILHGVVSTAPEPLATIFTDLGITPAAIEEKIEDTIGHGSTEPATIAPSQRVRATVHGAQEMAQFFNTTRINTSLIMLALCREIGVSAQILVNLNVSPDTIVEEILVKAGFTEEQRDVWHEASLAYADAVMYAMFEEAFPEFFATHLLPLPEGVEW